MNSRERQLTAIRHELPDRIPVDVSCVENAEQIAAALRIPVGSVLNRLGADGRILTPEYTGVRPTRPDGSSLSCWGTSGGDYGTAYWHPLDSDAGIAEVEHHPWPNPEDFSYDVVAAAARVFAADNAVRGPHWIPPFCTVCDLFGMENALTKMVAEEAVFEAALQCVFDRIYAICRRMFDACGDDLDVACFGDDFATQRGLMISPEHWRRHLKPLYARLFELGKSRGKPVWLHSCGDVTAVLPDLIDIGMDVWETVQLHTLPFGPRELKREYGSHLAFFGAVNTQRLPFATPESVREETLRCIEVLGKGGGYICGPDHHIRPDVSPTNTLALFDTATSFRRPGYTA